MIKPSTSQIIPAQKSFFVVGREIIISEFCPTAWANKIIFGWPWKLIIPAYGTQIYHFRHSALKYARLLGSKCTDGFGS